MSKAFLGLIIVFQVSFSKTNVSNTMALFENSDNYLKERPIFFRQVGQGFVLALGLGLVGGAVGIPLGVLAADREIRAAGGYGGLAILGYGGLGMLWGANFGVLVGSSIGVNASGINDSFRASPVLVIASQLLCFFIPMTAHFLVENSLKFNTLLVSPIINLVSLPIVGTLSYRLFRKSGSLYGRYDGRNFCLNLVYAF